MEKTPYGIGKGRLRFRKCELGEWRNGVRGRRRADMEGRREVTEGCIWVYALVYATLRQWIYEVRGME